MIIKEINKTEFDEFAKNNKQNSYYQTSNYATLMKNYKYDTMYIGAYHDNKLLCASLILYKSIAPTIKYGYAPRGFMLDYFDKDLLEAFTKRIKSFFAKKNFAFIKINPEIIYSKININNKKKEVIPQSKELITFMRSLDYEKLRDNLYFESMLPKYNAFIDLKTFDKSNVSKKCYVKSHSIVNSALKLRKGSLKDMKLLYEYIKENSNKTLNYFEDFYKLFNKDGMIDLLLIEIDYYKYLNVYNKKYEKLIKESEKVNNEFSLDPYDNDLYYKKTDLDKKISELEKKINIVNNRLKNGILSETIGGALIIKSNHKVKLVIGGTDENFPNLNYKYFLYYNMIEYYKKMGYQYFDLNGITGNFTDNNPYKKLNDFVLSFNPLVYEYIGEFDLVINNTYYNILWNSGKLKKEFIH